MPWSACVWFSLVKMWWALCCQKWTSITSLPPRYSHLVCSCFFNMSLNSKVWKWKTGELSARRNEKRKLLKPPSFSLSLTSSSPALPSGECFGAQLIFCLHNAFLQALYLCQSSFWSESGYHRLPTRCSCEWRNPPVMQDLCVCVRVRLCVCVCWSLGPSFQGKFTIN